MAVTATPVFVQLPKATPQSIVNADGTTKKTIATAGTNGAKVAAIIATSTDTGTRILQLFLTRSATNYLLGSTLIAIGAGTDGVASSSNLLTSIPGLPVDNDGQPYLFLESGDTLTVAVTVAVTAAKEIDVTALFGNF
jgi:hypothetical protein